MSDTLTSTAGRPTDRPHGHSPALCPTHGEVAATILKALAHEGRLLILCHLAAGEKSVTQLEQLLNQRQAAVSQQLARLREDGIVASRAEGKTRLYSLADARAARMVTLVCDLF